MSLNIAKYSAVERAISRVFAKEAQKQQSSFFPLVATRAPSSSADEKYAWLGDIPQMREWIGERVFNEIRSADYTLKNKHYELSYGVARTDVDDDRYGMLNLAVPEIARRAAKYPDKILFDLINSAESEVCFDGQFFFDTDHSWGDSGSQSNDLTYNAADHDAVTAEEFSAAFHAALKAMMSFQDDAGEPLFDPGADMSEMNNLLIVCHPTLHKAASDAFVNGLVLTSKTADAGNLVAATNNPLAVPSIFPSLRYSATTKFDLYYTGGALKPYLFQDRQPVIMDSFGVNSRKDKHIGFGADMRFNMGFLMWNYAVRTTFN